MHSEGEVESFPTTATQDISYPYSYSPPTERNGNGWFSLPSIQELREYIAPFRFELAAKEIVETLNPSENDKVLELGSGLGLLGQKIKRKVGGGLKYFGIDLALNSARASLGRGVLPAQGSVTSLPYADEVFDYLVTTDVLEHISDPEAAVIEMNRVLRPGGKAFVVIADPSEARFSNIPDHIKRANIETDVPYWEELFQKQGFVLKREESQKYRERDWRHIFNLPLIEKLKDKPGFACAFNPVDRPGVYILEKPKS